MVASSILGTFIVLISTGFFLIPWVLHHLSCDEVFSYKSFKEFKKLFIKIRFWSINPEFPGSLFAKDDKGKRIGEIHAGRIIINGGHILISNPIEYYRFLLWKSYFIKKANKIYNLKETMSYEEKRKLGQTIIQRGLDMIKEQEKMLNEMTEDLQENKYRFRKNKKWDFYD